MIAVILFTTLFVSSEGSTYAANMSAKVQAWANVNIDSKAPDSITPSKMNELMKANGKSEKARTEDIGGAIFEAASANGINPALMFAMFVHETGWGSNWKWTQVNNPGGIRCKTGYECKSKDGCSTCAKWTVFSSVKQGFQVKAEILRGYIENRGIKTIQQMLETYAPPSDNNDLYSDDGYIAAIGNNIAKLGAEASQFEGTMAVGEKVTYSDGTEVGHWKRQNFFMSSTVNSERVGVDKDDDIPSIISYSFNRFANDSVDKLSVVGVVMCLFLLAYISFTILAYTLIVKGKASAGGLFGKFIVIKGDIYGLGALKQVFIQAILVICIIAIYLTGLYLPIMGVIYTVWELIIYYTIGG